MQVLQELIQKENNYIIKSFDKVYNAGYGKQLRFWMMGFFILLILVLFLPWTQNIQSRGDVTTLYQNQRPQEINAIIPGKIIKWFVKEGDFVRRGDTLLQLADVKDDYLDPNLVGRTVEQLVAKKQKAGFYSDKVIATDDQITAMQNSRDLKINSLQNKLEQLHRKIQSDSAEWQAATIDFNIAKVQYERAKNMLDQGIISLVDFEKRTGTFQKAQAMLTEKLNKYENTQQDLTINRIEINNVQQETAEKVMKAIGEQASAQSDRAGTIGEVAKLENQLQNYRIRGSQRWLIAPQDGQVTNAIKAGLNEVVKEGEMIVKIIPTNIDYALELFVKPFDLVLIDTGQKVRFVFDGYPAIIFSGWPKASYGTFVGKIIAIETNLSSNGLFRVLVVEDENERKWPANLKLGTGAVGYALLKNVPIWYELWRNINGFPPVYYKSETSSKTSSKK